MVHSRSCGLTACRYRDPHPPQRARGDKLAELETPDGLSKFPVVISDGTLGGALSRREIRRPLAVDSAVGPG